MFALFSCLLKRGFGGSCRLAGLALAGALMAPAAAAAQERIDYGRWELLVGEEFAGPADSAALAARWDFEYPWGRNLGGNPETQYYTGRQVHTDSAGHLLLTAKYLDTPRPYQGKSLRYESGMLFSKYPGQTADRQQMGLYFLYEIRCRQPHDDNSFPAFWLFEAPDEIDIFEATRFGFSNNVILNTHSYWRKFWPTQHSCPCYFTQPATQPPLDEEFHTYGLATLPGELVFYFDGVPIRRETSRLPLGNPKPLIVNLAMWNWASVRHDTLAVDYVRTYRLRTVPADLNRHSFSLPDALLMPSALPQRAGADDAARQTWHCRPTADGRTLQLTLADNRNPDCGAHYPLPEGGRPWAPGWVLAAGGAGLVVETDPAAGPLYYTLLNVLGQVVRMGYADGASWSPNTAGWPPGAYRLALRQGAARATHPVYVLDQPAGSAPTAEWQQPAAGSQP